MSSTDVLCRTPSRPAVPLPRPMPSSTVARGATRRALNQVWWPWATVDDFGPNGPCDFGVQRPSTGGKSIP